MKVLSCFAGIGGFDLGFERAGMETVAHVEIDKYASQVFARHFPNSKHYEDIRAFTDVPSVDLVCGVAFLWPLIAKTIWNYVREAEPKE